MRTLAGTLQIDTTDELGRDVIGEHVWRVSGARHLAAVNLPRVMIKLLARWGGETIDRYIRDAPLRALTATYNAVTVTHAPPSDELVYPASAVAHLSAEISQADNAASTAGGRFVYNPKTKTVHMISSWCEWSRADPNRAACNREILDSWHPPSDTIPEAARNKCYQCAPPYRWISALEASDSE
jgi:hypothetical protein